MDSSEGSLRKVLMARWKSSTGSAARVRRSIQVAAAGRLVTLDVDGLPLKRSWCVVHPRARHLTPVADAFLQALTTV